MYNMNFMTLNKNLCVANSNSFSACFNFKAAQLVLIDLFNLNAPELSMMLTNLPKPFQDSATKILQTHMRSASRESRDSTSDVLSPKNVTPQQNRSRPPSR